MWVSARAEPRARIWRTREREMPAESFSWAQRATRVSPVIQSASVAGASESRFEVEKALPNPRASVRTSSGTSSARESAVKVWRVETA